MKPFTKMLITCCPQILLVLLLPKLSFCQILNKKYLTPLKDAAKSYLLNMRMLMLSIKSISV